MIAARLRTTDISLYPTSFRIVLLVSTFALATPRAGIAQCDLAWRKGAAAPGPAGMVHAAVELPNGELVAGGTFAHADSERVDNLASWGGSAWNPMAHARLGDRRTGPGAAAAAARRPSSSCPGAVR